MMHDEEPGYTEHGGMVFIEKIRSKNRRDYGGT